MSRLGRVEDTDAAAVGRQQQQQQQQQQQPKENGLVIENVPPTVEEAQLIDKIKTFGEVESIKIDGRKAHVIMNDANVIPTVVKYMHGSTLDGARLRAVACADLNEIQTRVLFVANYPHRYTTEDDIWETFGEYGTVNTVRMDTKFSFVEMNSIQQAQKCAAALDGYIMYDSPLSVSLSRKHKVLNEIRSKKSGAPRFKGKRRSRSRSRSRKRKRRKSRSRSKKRKSMSKSRRRSRSRSRRKKRSHSPSSSKRRKSPSKSKSRSRSRSRNKSRSKSRSKSKSRNRSKSKSRSRSRSRGHPRNRDSRGERR